MGGVILAEALSVPANETAKSVPGQGGLKRQIPEVSELQLHSLLGAGMFQENPQEAGTQSQNPPKDPNRQKAALSPASGTGPENPTFWK